MAPLTVGVVGTSWKENERRVPIHPDHLGRIGEDVRGQLIFERGYGLPFGATDEALASAVGGVATRGELFERCDVLLLLKPEQPDFELIREGDVLWGWAHCVQDPRRTQTAIDRRLTLIAFESMNTWGPQGAWRSHIFAANNEIAGYAAVLHATGLAGMDGRYGPPRKAVVIHLGSVSRGAIRALGALGFDDVTVFTRPRPNGLIDPVPGPQYRQMVLSAAGELRVIERDGGSHPLLDDLADADVIVNGILQDPDEPLMFVTDEQVGRLKRGCLIVDVSCDAGMGFSFARPTTFAEPAFQVGPVTYYGVDHTPSYLWRSASWRISQALLPFLSVIVGGPAAWEADEMIRRAIEVRNGVIENAKILSFQRRSAEYPHPICGGTAPPSGPAT